MLQSAKMILTNCLQNRFLYRICMTVTKLMFFDNNKLIIEINEEQVGLLIVMPPTCNKKAYQPTESLLSISKHRDTTV